MNKKEFLKELEYSLAGRLPESDIIEILSDYGDIFDSMAAAGKSEEETAEEIGSPARIARTILDDEIVPDRNAEFEKLAPMSRRLGAYFLDSMLLGVIGIGALFAVFAPFMYMARTSVGVHSVNMEAMRGAVVYGGEPATRFAFANIIMLFLIFGAFNLFTTIILWATNGFTPGKYILNMRTVKTDGSKISFLDALLRELVIKCIANSMLSGLLNIGSFIWGCSTDDHKTVHDLAARTRVVEWDRSVRKARRSSGPLEY